MGEPGRATRPGGGHRAARRIDHGPARRAGPPPGRHEISRPAWKNLVFTGGPGAGKSRAARAVARIYHELGLLAYGQLIEIAAADLTGITPGRPGSCSARRSRPPVTC